MGMNNQIYVLLKLSVKPTRMKLRAITTVTLIMAPFYMCKEYV